MPIPFRMKLLKKCFCGCTVRTGSLLICYITLIQSIVMILNILSGTTPDIGKDKAMNNEYKRTMIWISVASIVVVGHSLYGTYKKKAKYLVPYILYKIAVLFVFTMMLGFAPAIVEEAKSYLPTENGEDFLPWFIMTVLLFIAIEAYSLLILFSHYHNVHQQSLEALNAGQVGFATTIPQAESAVPCPNPYSADLPKKQPPPPYAL